MGSESSDADGDRVNTSTRKNVGKVPRKIHKAEREKLKRDRLNDLFLDLGRALDLEHPNNGKASILRETIRLLGELLAQVDNLKKENVALLSESNYVTIEKNELVEETSSLDAQIKRLQREIDEKSNCSNLEVYQPQSNLTPQLAEEQVVLPLISHASESVPIVRPVLVLPLHNESQGFYPDLNMAKVPPSVTRPRPRYPSSSDSWPSHILTKPTNAVTEDV